MPEDVLASVTRLVARYAPSRPDPDAIAPDAELVSDLAFDSVRLVELLLECGEAWGITLPIERLLDGSSLTVRAVAERVDEARRR